MNKQRIKKQSDLNFSLSLALFDTLPVIFFCLGMLLIASRFHNVFFLIGIILCTLAGCGKVLWKILIASSGYNIYLLNRQLRILMPLGFFFVINCWFDYRKKYHPFYKAYSTNDCLSILYFLWNYNHWHDLYEYLCF